MIKRTLMLTGLPNQLLLSRFYFVPIFVSVSSSLLSYLRIATQKLYYGISTTSNIQGNDSAFNGISSAPCLLNAMLSIIQQTSRASKITRGYEVVLKTSYGGPLFVFL